MLLIIAASIYPNTDVGPFNTIKKTKLYDRGLAVKWPARRALTPKIEKMLTVTSKLVDKTVTFGTCACWPASLSWKVGI